MRLCACVFVCLSVYVLACPSIHSAEVPLQTEDRSSIFSGFSWESQFKSVSNVVFSHNLAGRAAELWLAKSHVVLWVSLRGEVFRNFLIL